MNRCVTRFALVSCIIVIVASAPARAAQPLFTDDAAVVDPKTCQLEAWVQPFHHGREYAVVPACNPFQNLELSVGGARAVTDGEWSSLFLLQAKTIVVSSIDSAWSVGAEAGALRETGVPHGRSAFQTYYGRALVSFYPTDEVEFDLNVGIANTYGTGTYGLAGVALQYMLIERLQLLIETFRDEPGRSKYQAGMRFSAIPNRFEVFVSYGNRFSGGSTDWWTTVGIRLQTGAFLP